MAISDSESFAKALKSGQTVTWVGILINVILIVLKLMAGIFGHSQALIADAVHTISDFFTDAVVLVGLKMGRKAPDEKHHFGHARIETLASAIVGVALIVTAIYLGLDSVKNIYHHAEYHPTWIALAAAAISIALKEALYHYTVHVGKKIRSSAIIANAWHHRSDAFSSVAVLLGVAGAIIRPSWHILDAYAALLVSFFIVSVGLDIIKNTLREFTDTAPSPEILDRMTRCAIGVEGVIDVHDLKVRTSGGFYQAEIHILVNGDITVANGHRIAKDVEKRMKEDVNHLNSVIVHVDPALEEDDLKQK